MIGPGDQVREERHEQRVVEEVARRRGAAQVHVERVGHRREGIERDADRQHDVRAPAAGSATPNAAISAREVLEQERAVLEVAEHAEVGDHRQQHPGAPRDRPLRLDQALRGVPVDHRRDPQQDHERRIPRRVEQVARDQQVDLLAWSTPSGSECSASTMAKNTTNVSELKTTGRARDALERASPHNS